MESQKNSSCKNSGSACFYLDSAAERNFTKGKGIEHMVACEAEMW